MLAIREVSFRKPREQPRPYIPVRDLVNWPLYSHLLSASVRVFNAVIHRIYRLWGISSPISLKPLDVKSIVSSECVFCSHRVGSIDAFDRRTAFSSLTAWLEQKVLRSVTGDVVARLHHEQRQTRGTHPISFAIKLV